jgi:hypothetical protein
VLSWHILYDPRLNKDLSRMSCPIEKRGEACELTVMRDCAEAPLTAKQVGGDGWHRVLSNLETWLETGQPLAPGSRPVTSRAG